MIQQASTPLQFEFVCPLASGMHARPASHLAEVANQFESECVVTNLRNGLHANAKSVLAVIAADVRHGDPCLIQVHGPDEQAAHLALLRFVEDVLSQCDVPLVEIGAVARNSTPPRVLRAAGVNCCFGVPASRGLAQGKVVIASRMALPSNPDVEAATDRQPEQERIRHAIAAVRERIAEKLTNTISSTGVAILQAELALAGDVILAEKLMEQVSQGKSAGQAVVETGKYFIDLLRHSENEWGRERAADIEEICLQLLDEIHGGEFRPKAAELCEPSVVVADTLAPQQVLDFDRRWLEALVLEDSGATSHAVILARSWGIPVVAGVRGARLLFSPGQEVVVDANRGFVVPQLSSSVHRFYERERRTLERRRELFPNPPAGPATTADGKTVEVAANASSPEEVALAFENSADGIGLFRTEMLFLRQQGAPSEEEQFTIYVEAARASAGKPVIIRTLDLGGDKSASYLNLPSESNPFLGYRGVRLYGQHQELLQSQLRAILRASASGNVQVMAPMISSLEEVLQFKAAIAQAKQFLASKNIAFKRDIRVGIMIEVPSVAYILEDLCAEVDFFSLGTNDLSQYFFAADRANPRVAELASVRQPGFLRFLKQIVEQIHRKGKWAGMCGEMAADIRHLPLLLGLGLDGISLPAGEIPDFKRKTSKLRVAECQQILTRAVSRRATAEVDDLLGREQASQPLQPLLTEELIQLESKSQSKEEVIQEIVDVLYTAGRTEDRGRLEEALWAREEVYSTGLGHGFAAPHCKTEAIAADSITVLKLNQPIDWGSADKEPVYMVVLMAIREAESASRHMQVFSWLARKLMNEGFRERLLTIATPREMMTYLAGELH